jgi:hypothetical protein
MRTRRSAAWRTAPSTSGASRAPGRCGRVEHRIQVDRRLDAARAHHACPGPLPVATLDNSATSRR